MRNTYHTIIIGAGPAGLATACSLTSLGSKNFLLIERGKTLANRQRASAEDIPSGVGGAGLFSDGKFSFYPSATWLWKNLSPDNLSPAYHWLKVILQSYDVSTPDLPTQQAANDSSDQVFKAYPSFYIDFDQRYNMIDQWINQFRSNILTDTTVDNILKQNNLYCVVTSAGVFYAENVVIATGRMGPLQLPAFSLPMVKKFQRIEVGVRIKGSHEHPFFSELLQHGQYLDPKFIFNHQDHPQVSWRTFCFCKRGEIMQSGSDGYVTLSGRADCPPTDESNIGFNTRIKLPSINHSQLPKLQTSFSLNLSEVFLNPSILSQYFDPTIAEYVFLGLKEIQNHFSSLKDANALEIVGPTIEGVGDYPVVTNQLETEHPGVYVAGDALGLFRGLTAALLSGHCIGQQIINHTAYVGAVVNL